MVGQDLTGQRFGKLTVLKLIPREERTWSNKERAWECQCDCGNKVIVRQRNLLASRGTQSCGCLRKEMAFLKTNMINGLDLNFLQSFDDFDKFLFLHRTLRTPAEITSLSIDDYKNLINYFYYQEQFNKIYAFWKQAERSPTFYDLAKPSVDHIIPKAKGGTGAKENLQYLTIFENLCKRDMTMDEWNSFKKQTNTTSDLFYDSIKEVM